MCHLTGFVVAGHIYKMTNKLTDESRVQVDLGLKVGEQSSSQVTNPAVGGLETQAGQTGGQVHPGGARLGQQGGGQLIHACPGGQRLEAYP